VTCNHHTLPPMTLREAKDAMGFDCEYREFSPPKDLGLDQAVREFERRKAEWDAAHASKENIAPDAAVFMCGDIVIPVCACGTAADYLCDYPVGHGKTCDLNLCVTCRRNVGEELDLCALHYPAWCRESGVARVNPWPPPRRVK
jgi:hypothetical protein